MTEITEYQVKELVNLLIDLKKTNDHGFNEESMTLREHGINIAIGRINSRLLNTFRNEDERYDLIKLKTA